MSRTSKEHTDMFNITIGVYVFHHTPPKQYAYIPRTLNMHCIRMLIYAAVLVSGNLVGCTLSDSITFLKPSVPGVGWVWLARLTLHAFRN